MRIPHVKNGRPDSNDVLDTGYSMLVNRKSKIGNRKSARGFTFTELVIVIVILSLFVLLAQMHLLGPLRKNRGLPVLSVHKNKIVREKLCIAQNVERKIRIMPNPAVPAVGL